MNFKEDNFWGSRSRPALLGIYYDRGGKYDAEALIAQSGCRMRSLYGILDLVFTQFNKRGRLIF